MWNLEIENIGGIRSGETTLNQGANIVQASNFQGKSSLLSAIQTVMGTTGHFGEHHPLMEGASEGHVTLDMGDKTYTTTLERVAGDNVSRGGETYLTEEEDQVSARLFAFLGEDNPVRAAVREKDEERLTKLLKKPLDLENINNRIDSLQREIVDFEDELSDAESAAEKLPPAQEKVTQLEKELKELREKRDELEQKVDEDAEQKNLREDLTNKQSNVESKKRRVEKLENQIERKGRQLNEKREELDELKIPDELVLDTDIDSKEDQLNNLELKIDLLGDLHRANKAVLDENELDLVTDVNRSIEGDTFECWLCGDETDKETVEENLKHLQEQQQSLREEQSSLEEEIKEIKQKKSEIDSKVHRESRLEANIKELKASIQDDKNDIAQIENQIESLEQEVEELEEEYKEAEQNEEEYSAELKTVQQKIGTKSNELERAERKLEQLETEAEDREAIEADIQVRKDELNDLRHHREQKYDEVKERFDDAIDDIINKFAPGFDGGHLKKKKTSNDTVKYEISVAREGRETRLHRLSEGEVELVGIAAALAGYRTFNVSERVPCFLLDGVGQLAAEHIHNMIDYLEDTTEVLVTTAYPEAGEFEGETVLPDDWEVVSNKTAAT